MKKGSRLIVEVIAFSAIAFISLFIFQDSNRDTFFKVHHYSFSSECELCLSGQEPLTPAHTFKVNIKNLLQLGHSPIAELELLGTGHFLLIREKFQALLLQKASLPNLTLLTLDKRLSHLNLKFSDKEHTCNSANKFCT